MRNSTFVRGHLNTLNTNNSLALGVAIIVLGALGRLVGFVYPEWFVHVSGGLAMLPMATYLTLHFFNKKHYKTVIWDGAVRLRNKKTGQHMILSNYGTYHFTKNWEVEFEFWGKNVQTFDLALVGANTNETLKIKVTLGIQNPELDAENGTDNDRRENAIKELYRRMHEVAGELSGIAPTLNQILRDTANKLKKERKQAGEDLYRLILQNLNLPDRVYLESVEVLRPKS